MTGVVARLRAGVPAGVLATLAMDGAMVGAAVIGGPAFDPDRLKPAVIGRWGRGLLRGRWRHDDASREQAGRLDVPFGIATHYLTGIALTEAFLLVPWRRPGATIAAAVGYGVATSALPLLVLFPSLGYGAFGSRSGEPARLVRVMLIGHVAFGAGIGLGTVLLAPRPR